MYTCTACMYMCSVCVCVCVCVCLLSRVWFFVIPWTSLHGSSVHGYMEFSRQEYWRGLPFPTPGDLPEPGIKTASLASPALTGRFVTTMPPGKPKLTVLQFGGFWERINWILSQEYCLILRESALPCVDKAFLSWPIPDSSSLQTKSSN